LILYKKWDMDGASGQQTTGQKWLPETVTLEKDQSTDTDDDKDDRVVIDIFCDNAVFVISFVPLQLTIVLHGRMKDHRLLVIATQ